MIFLFGVKIFTLINTKAYERLKMSNGNERYVEAIDYLGQI